MTSRLTTARPGPSLSPAPPGGPAGRYLTNPGGYTGHLARLLLTALEHYGPAAGPLLAVAVTAVIAGRAWLRRRQHAAFVEAARQVTILAPPQAGPAGAEALWAHLTGLLAAGPSARVSFEALASPEEITWCTSDPAEIARMQASQPAGAPAWPGPDSGTEDSDPEDMLP